MNVELKKTEEIGELCCFDFIKKCFNVTKEQIYDDFKQIQNDINSTNNETNKRMKELKFDKRNVHFDTEEIMNFLTAWLDKKYKINLVIVDHVR